MGLEETGSHGRLSQQVRYITGECTAEWHQSNPEGGREELELGHSHSCAVRGLCLYLQFCQNKLLFVSPERSSYALTCI